MTHYINLIQTHVRHKIELISILDINCCVRSVFAYCELTNVASNAYSTGHKMKRVCFRCKRSANVGVVSLETTEKKVTVSALFCILNAFPFVI